jgi:hypothetical protein
LVLTTDEEKRMTMKIPARAYAEQHPKDLAVGSLFRFRGVWALRICASGPEEFPGFLLLEGENAGSILKVGPGMARSAAVVEPFGWFPAIAVDARPGKEADQVLALTITGSGLVIVGLDARDRYDSAYLAITADGQAVEVQDRQGELWFGQWSVELCHQDRPLISLGTLLEIDRHTRA